MKRITYLLTICLLALMSACTEEPTVTTGSISGLVTDATDGTEPIAGVNVTIPVLGESTTTGINGTFTFTDVESGNYTLVFTKSGYITEQKNASVVAGKSSAVNVQMKATEKKAEIEFNPSSLNFSTNLSDLSVTIKNNGNSTAEWSLNLGNNPWLSVSEKAGSIQAGRTQSIVFTVDRNFLSEPKSTVVNLHAFGNSYPLTISCAPSNAKSEMTIDPKSIDFGTTDTEKSITIRNTGTATLSWTATGITENAISLSQMSGSVAAGGNSVIKVLLDRSKISGSMSTSFTINDG
ncbi:MAG: carboxypeptidase-like regulatory domain-containing protein, partial [Muribaculaceae bacterium]|nr:carboxypeptidase-like regulatory domain-containing protein [Muribaculaceae bacterium]